MTKLYLTLQTSECYIKIFRVSHTFPTYQPVLPRIFGVFTFHIFVIILLTECQSNRTGAQTRLSPAPPTTRKRPAAGFATGRLPTTGHTKLQQGFLGTGERPGSGVPPSARAASGRNRIRSWNAAPRRPPCAGRRWPPPDRPAPRPRRTPSYRPRSRSHPPRPHAEWSPR